MNGTFTRDSHFHGRLRSGASGMFWLGLVMALLGCGAIIFPLVATLAATVLIGWLFLIFGVITLSGAFSIHGTGPFFAAALLGLLALGAGVFLLFSPLAGAVALTLIVGVMCLLQGAFELAFAFEMRPYRGWLGMLVSGLASIAVALIILAGWPGISLVALGILFGVNFLTTGFGFMAAARAFRGT
jgi:uncharacterized membrane protein HdeD (DUF308 family)